MKSHSQREGKEMQISQVRTHRNVMDKGIWMGTLTATALVCLFEKRDKDIDILNVNLCLFYYCVSGSGIATHI